MSNNKAGPALLPSDNRALFRFFSIFSEKVRWRGRSNTMQSRFFQPGIAPDVARIAYAFAARLPTCMWGL